MKRYKWAFGIFAAFVLTVVVIVYGVYCNVIGYVECRHDLFKAQIVAKILMEQGFAEGYVYQKINGSNYMQEKTTGHIYKIILIDGEAYLNIKSSDDLGMDEVKDALVER